MICELVRPKVGIITAIGPMHLERFGSLEAIERTKREIHQLVPVDGLKIDPGDDAISEIIKYFELDPVLVKEVLLNFKGAKNRLEVSENNGITMRSVGGEPTIPSVRSQDTLNSEDVRGCSACPISACLGLSPLI